MRKLSPQQDLDFFKKPYKESKSKHMLKSFFYFFLGIQMACLVEAGGTVNTLMVSETNKYNTIISTDGKIDGEYQQLIRAIKNKDETSILLNMHKLHYTNMAAANELSLGEAIVLQTNNNISQQTKDKVREIVLKEPNYGINAQIRDIQASTSQCSTINIPCNILGNMVESKQEKQLKQWHIEHKDDLYYLNNPEKAYEYVDALPQKWLEAK